MKTKQYVKKYNLDIKTIFNRKRFVEDMKYEFYDMFNNTSKGMHAVPRFDKTLDDLKRKWDGVFNRSIIDYETSEKFWNYFYATEVIPFRNSLFGDWKKAKHNYRYNNDPDFQRRYDSYQAHKSYEEFEERMYNDASQGFWERMLSSFKNDFIKIDDDLAILGFSDKSELSEDSLKSKFRSLSKKHHPDFGGKTDSYIKILDAKDNLERYLKL